jgi:hypothetical protein
MSKITVEKEIDKALEAALAELRGALVLIGKEAAGGEAPFLGAERRFTAAMLCFARRLLAVVLSFYDMDAKYIRHKDKIWRRKKTDESKEYFSAWGRLEVERGVYLPHGQSTGKQLVPLERRAGLVDKSWTPQAAEAMARLVQSAPSREAVENLEPLGLLPYSRSSFERVALAVGERWEAERETLEDALIEAVQMPEEAAGISVAFDRVRIDTDETVLDPVNWPNGRKQPRQINGRMAYCAAVTLHDAQGEPICTKRYGRNALKEQGSPHPGLGEWQIREQVSWDVQALLEKRPELGERAVVLSDGGPELERIIGEDFPDWLNLCDLYHFSQKLDAALEDAGFDDGLRHKKRENWLEMLKSEDGAITQIEAELSFFEGEKVDAALTYIDNRRERFAYAQAHRNHLPVGSGHVEATCKSLVEVRMRRCGQRWTPQSSQALLNLRVLALSDLWQEGIELLLAGYENDDFKPCPKPARRSAA